MPAVAALLGACAWYVFTRIHQLRVSYATPQLSCVFFAFSPPCRNMPRYHSRCAGARQQGRRRATCVLHWRRQREVHACARSQRTGAPWGRVGPGDRRLQPEVVGMNVALMLHPVMFERFSG